MTGKFIQQFLQQIEKKEGRKFAQIIIWTSPFARCIQTASNVAKVLGVQQVEINYLFGEVIT